MTQDRTIRWDGSVEQALSLEAVAVALQAVTRLEAETVAICLLHANANPAHERQLRDAILAAHPALPVSISSDVSPEIREYERSSTTVLNALLIPVVRSYIERLTRRLAERGVPGRLLLVQSNGGVCSPEIAAAQPVRLGGYSPPPKPRPSATPVYQGQQDSKAIVAALKVFLGL